MAIAISAVVRRHWSIVLIALVGSFLMLAHLGRDYLWEDEGDTAVLALNIQHHGLPVAWDGVTFVAPDYGQRLTGPFVMISHPWLQYYAVAGSFAVFGKTPFAARLPFAFAGIATIVLVYAMLICLLQNRLVAISTATLLALSLQFLLYARQARNYSLHALLTCALLWAFLRLRSRAGTVTFVTIAILLFHSHPIGLGAVAALGVMTFVSRSFTALRRQVWLAAGIVFLYAAPWVLIARSGYVQNTNPLEDGVEFISRLFQFAAEYASVTPLIGIVLLTAWVLFRARRTSGAPSAARRARCAVRSEAFEPVERSLIACCVGITLVEAILVAGTHSANAIWVVGLHHTPDLIPLAMIVAGVLIAKASAGLQPAWVILMLLFAGTRLVQPAPWAFWARPMLEHDPSRIVTLHVPDRLQPRLIRSGLFHFVRSITRSGPDRGTVAEISDFLRANAAPSDVVITNYAWEPLYFHTRLPQGAKISPLFPIYSAARAHHLPTYVFGTEGVRWIVWRRAWPAYFPEQDCARILEQLSAAGMVPRLVQAFAETLYENRENVHFHRYAGKYLFPWYSNLPDALIFRVESVPEALDRDRQQLSRNPDDFETLSHFGSTLIMAGQVDAAVRAFQRVVEMAPNDPLARRNLANVLFDTRRATDALVHARRAVELNQSDPASHELLGRTLAVLGEVEEAISHFNEAIRLDPTNPDAREHLGQLMRALSAPV